MRCLVLVTLLTLAWSLNGWSLTLKDSTLFGNLSYVVSWTDLKGKKREAAIVKSGVHAGTCQFFSYYDGTANVVITPPDPSNTDPQESGFGSSCHHNSTSVSQPTVAMLWQSSATVLFSVTETVDAAPETNVYTFMDGHDYFQWSETVNTNLSTQDKAANPGGDSRGPYSSVSWDGIGGPTEGVAYGAQHDFMQPALIGAAYPNRSGPWTFGGTCDIPFTWEWANAREIGYVATQTYTEQAAGNETWGASLNLADTASGATIDPNNDSWEFDFQMNFYDEWMKITWGMPWGYMNNGDNWASSVPNCIKNGWGEYSLSIVMDAKADSGVMRLRDENRAIQSGKVTFSATAGTVRTTGPVGTVNPNTQTLTPAGFDHNYRTWWMTAAAGKALCSLNVGGATPLVNPTIRISGISALPASVSHNGTALTLNTGYYASFDTADGEVWLTIVGSFSGNNTIGVNLGVGTAAKVQGLRTDCLFRAIRQENSPLVVFDFYAAAACWGSIDLFDQAGRQVATVYRGSISQGLNTALWKNSAGSHAGLLIARFSMYGDQPTTVNRIVSTTR